MLQALLATFRADQLRVCVFRDRGEAARAAAEWVAGAMTRFFLTHGRVRMVFAAAPSQDAFLGSLVARPDLAWDRVTAFHMDEYLGLTADHPASFRSYLNHHLFKPLKLAHDRLRLIPGESTESPHQTCLSYESLLRAEPPEIVCAGIGENGHLAFNDPPVADFHDPLWMKVVRLDAACRAQQVNDGAFVRLDDVPTHAYTMTVPALLAAQVMSVMVPGPRKAAAVRAVLRGPIDESCPASILRRHANATLWLDSDSASLIL